jgi:hypothetical protein
MTINCSKGNLLFSDPNHNKTDALTVFLKVDNTLRCRTIMHNAHSWLLPRPKRAAGDPANPTSVLCREGKLRFSDDKPDDSEANELAFATTGNLQCRLLFLDFLNHVATFVKN